MPFTIVQTDITQLPVDCIVNAANTQLQRGGGVCGAIFEAAGSDELQSACSDLAPVETGKAVITPGFGLPAKFIIHTPGPVYDDSSKEAIDTSERLLTNCYQNSLALAWEQGFESLAFPLISSGIYGYPKDKALQVATAAVVDFLEAHDMNVFLAVFDASSVEVSAELLGSVQSFIDDTYVEAREKRPDRLRSKVNNSLRPFAQASLIAAAEPAAALEEDMRAQNKEATLVTARSLSLGDVPPFSLDEPFSTTLLRLIDESGMSDAEVYHRANLDRRLFSKIRSNEDYRPSKKTAVALAVALKLGLDATEDLLDRAGYSLSRALLFDVIIEYFIVQGSYNIFEINEVLFRYDQPLLGA